MLKKLICLGLITSAILNNLGTIGYAQPVLLLALSENQITQTQLKEVIPYEVTEGFEAFCTGKTNNPFSIWAEHSIPQMRIVMADSKAIEGMKQLFEEITGRCIGYSVMGSTTISERTQVVYVESDHENAPLFWRFTVYRSPKGWLISGFNMNTNASEIIPENVLK